MDIYTKLHVQFEGPLKHTCMPSSLCFLRLLLAVTVSQALLIFYGLDYFLLVLRSTGQVFCRMSFSWDLSDVFLVVKLGQHIFERKVTEVKCHSHGFTSRVHAIRMT